MQVPESTDFNVGYLLLWQAISKEMGGRPRFDVQIWENEHLAVV